MHCEESEFVEGSIVHEVTSGIWRAMAEMRGRIQNFNFNIHLYERPKGQNTLRTDVLGAIQSELPVLYFSGNRIAQEQLCKASPLNTE